MPLPYIGIIDANYNPSGKSIRRLSKVDVRSFPIVCGCFALGSKSSAEFTFKQGMKRALIFLIN